MPHGDDLRSSQRHGLTAHGANVNCAAADAQLGLSVLVIWFWISIFRLRRIFPYGFQTGEAQVARSDAHSNA
jgi:hypothetical protein